MSQPTGAYRWLLCLGVLLAAGCEGPDVVPIAGVVTHQGQPVPNLRIYFMPVHGRPSWAISDANGRFVLDYDYDLDGAKIGKHRIYVVDEGSYVDPTLEQSGVKAAQRKPRIAAIIKKYGDLKNTALEVEVTKADYNFQLKLD